MKLIIKQLKTISENIPLKIFHIIKGIFNYFSKKNINLHSKRYQICKQCKNKIKLDNIEFCDICGCVIKFKTSVKEETCPLDKW